jgi:hypothetical protein
MFPVNSGGVFILFHFNSKGKETFPKGNVSFRCLPMPASAQLSCDYYYARADLSFS